MNKTVFKSIGAVVGGMLAGAILSVATDTVLESLKVYPPIGLGIMSNGMLALALTYRAIFTGLSGYVTAALAPANPMKHVRVLGTIGVVVTALGTIVGWNLGAHWYPIALTIVTFPCVWLGGTLRLRKQKPPLS